MNNYRVRITRRDKALMCNYEYNHIMELVLYEMVAERHGELVMCDSGCVEYVVSIESEATYVYSLLKRFLDMSKYSVTLELPGKGEQR